MTYRALSFGLAAALVMATPVSSAALLTTPVQSTTFCVGSCGQFSTTAGFIQSTKGSTTEIKQEFAAGTFNTFNTSLGTLVSAKFTLTSLLTQSVGFIRFVQDPLTVDSDDDFSLVVKPDLRVAGFGPVFPNTALLSLLTEVPYPDDIRDFASENRNGSATLQSPPTNLGFFTTGSAFGVNFSHRMTLTNTQSDNATLLGNATWAGILQLEYAYEERPIVTVPEPGTLALVGLGLLSGVAGLRKRNAQAG